MNPTIRDASCTWQAILEAVTDFVERCDVGQLAEYDANVLTRAGFDIRMRLHEEVEGAAQTVTVRTEP